MTIQPEPRITGPTLKVLTCLMETTEGLSGAQITKVAKLASGTLYPILIRLEGCGWLQSQWEEADPVELGRPRRRFYKVTPLGARKTKATMQEFMRPSGRLSWA